MSPFQQSNTWTFTPPILGDPFKHIPRPQYPGGISGSPESQPQPDQLQPANTSGSLSGVSDHLCSFVNTFASDISPSESDSTPFSRLISTSPLERRPVGRPGAPPQHRYNRALEILREGKLGPADLLLHVLDTDNVESSRFQTGLCCKGGKLSEILETVASFHEGRERLKDWMKGQGLDLIGEIVSKEMDIVKQAFAFNTAHVTPTFISNWTLESAVGSVTKHHASVLTAILLHAAQTRIAQEKNATKRPDAVSLPALLSHIFCL
jgi:hypothetical protein